MYVIEGLRIDDQNNKNRFLYDEISWNVKKCDSYFKK